MDLRPTRRLAVLWLAAGAASCAGSGASTGRQGALTDAAAQEYRLGPGDQIHIAVFGIPDLSGDFLVSAHGTIAYPLLGEVQAQGKTLTELSSGLADTLRHGYVREPNVTAQVMNYRPFFILGEVTRPGNYPYSASLTVMNAVATANGFTYRADEHHVFIKHADEDTEHSYPLTSKTPVLPGDTIRIPERRF